MDVGVDRVVDYAERMGITTFVKSGAYNDRQPAIAWGLTDGVHPLDMARCLWGFSQPRGKVIPLPSCGRRSQWQYTLENAPTQTQVLTPQTSYLMTDMLKSGIVGAGATGGGPILAARQRGKQEPPPTTMMPGLWATPDLVARFGSVPMKPVKIAICGATASAVPCRPRSGAIMKEVVKDTPATDFPGPAVLSVLTSVPDRAYYPARCVHRKI